MVDLLRVDLETENTLRGVADKDIAVRKKIGKFTKLITRYGNAKLESTHEDQSIAPSGEGLAKERSSEVHSKLKDRESRLIKSIFSKIDSYNRHESNEVNKDLINLPLQGRTATAQIYRRSGGAEDNRQSKSRQYNASKIELPRPHRMSSPDLLKEVGGLTIGGLNVRFLFETNQIDHIGLSKIVESHRNNKDISSLFNNIQLGQERRRERAIEIKHGSKIVHTAVTQDTADPANASNSALPNTPDVSTLQPLNIMDDNEYTSDANDSSVPRGSSFINLNDKTTVIVLVSITLMLILWIILVII